MKSSNGLLVSLEGISGSGKTYLLDKLQKKLKNVQSISVREIMERNSIEVDLRIIEILSSSDDPFFRMGLPLCETFLLLALKMYDYEAVIVKALNAGKVVIEDRSIDTIAVYQSVLLGAEHPDLMLDQALEIFSLAAKWRRPPDITFLIEDYFDVSIERAQKRNNRKYTKDELSILRNANYLYTKYADMHSTRMIRLDRRTMCTRKLVQTISNRILERIQKK